MYNNYYGKVKWGNSDNIFDIVVTGPRTLGAHKMSMLRERNGRPTRKSADGAIPITASV